MVGGCAAPGALHADRAEDRLLAAWEKRMVRPCVKSGSRMVC
jgi:hypothetical protein